MMIKTIPVYPNKWRYYMSPLINNPELLEFNWFICSRPYHDNIGNHALEVDKYSMFFDESSGLTYHVTFDATEKGPCRLLITQEISQKEFNRAIKLKFCGIATKNSITDDCKCNLLCKNVEFGFCDKVVEVSKKCPYIEYARLHYSHLSKSFNDFPSKEKIDKAIPGKFSLKIKKFIDMYLLL